MGVEGTLEYLSDLFARKPKKKKQLKTVALKVRMCCEGCVRQVKNVLSSMKGVITTDVDLKQQKATVTGYVEPKKVLERVRTTKKMADFWPYVPYTMVAHPYIAQAYDKKAPAGHVKYVDMSTATITESIMDDQYTTMFSDDNPNACSIM
ncbi:hypothetical protein L1049_025655 [Liquidambar formosana]|uniref:HMA domain-containing protein n=1 Tax=Liquidambar formosana TaxID=63359 RepID=A0AAP0NDI1_LIQFO